MFTRMKIRIFVAAAFAAAFVVFVLLLNHSGGKPFYLYNQAGLSYENVKVEKVLSQTLKKDASMPGMVSGSQKLRLRILTGPHKGMETTADNYLTPDVNVLCKEGMTVVARINEKDGKVVSALIFNYDRIPVLAVAVVALLVVLCFIGGKRGVKSVLGLLFILICLFFVFLPLLYQGYSPEPAALLIAVLTTAVVLWLIGGFTAKTLTAVLGTVCGILITGAFSGVLGALSHLSGLNNAENTESLLVISRSTHLQIPGLLFASILISSLGAVMDMAMSMSSAIGELYEHDTKIAKKVLFRSAMNVGRDMMGTMVNTLILAFAGSWLVTLIIIKSYGTSLRYILNTDMVSMEILQSVCSSFAVLLVVPITAFLSTQFFPKIAARLKDGELSNSKKA